MSEALPSVPSFSEHQVHDLTNIVRSVVQQYFAPSNQPLSTSPSSTPPPSNLPSSTPPAPQKAQKEEDEQLLQQATAKSTTESISKSTLSTIPRLCTIRSSGDSAACLSNLACQHINTLLDYTLLDYIGHSKGIEATGQG